jgi:hypothetical protein
MIIRSLLPSLFLCLAPQLALAADAQEKPTAEDLIRQKISWILMATSTPKMGAAEAFQTYGKMPETVTLSYTPGKSDNTTKYVAKMTYAKISKTVSTVTATGQGDPAISDKTITFTGTGQTDGVVTWKCSSTIDPKYLPAVCR